MQEQPNKPATQEKEIGNSRFTQAMGEAGNIGIAATIVSTIVIGAILYFGKGSVNWIRKTIETIEGGFEWFKKKIGNGGGASNGGKKISEMMASLAAASGIGYLIGHLAMIPAYRDGYKKADAEKKQLAERGEMIELLKNEVAAKDKMIAELKNESSEEKDREEKRLTVRHHDKKHHEGKWAQDSMKPRQHHARSASHTDALDSEEALAAQGR